MSANSTLVQNDSIQNLPFHVVESNGVKLSIQNMTVVARWRYNLNNQICSLCHIALGKPVKLTSNRDHVYKTNIIIGSCNHGFHEQCMNEWLLNKNVNCPDCLNEWKQLSNNNAGIISYTS
jgi:hypothetical protein